MRKENLSLSQGAEPSSTNQLMERLVLATNGKMAVNIPKMAELLSLSRTTAYTLARRADFPAFQVGGRTLVSVPGLIQWVEEQVRRKGGGE